MRIGTKIIVTLRFVFLFSRKQTHTGTHARDKDEWAKYLPLFSNVSLLHVLKAITEIHGNATYLAEASQHTLTFFQRGKINNTRRHALLPVFNITT